VRYCVNSKFSSSIEPSFLSRIESLLDSYNKKKDELESMIKSTDESLTKSINYEVDELWKAKVKDYASALETKGNSIEALINDSKPEELMDELQKKYFVKILRASQVYFIKEKDGIKKDFESNYINDFYSLSELSKIALKNDCIPKFLSSISNYFSIDDVEKFTSSIIIQLAKMKPERVSLDEKIEELNQGLFKDISSFCLSNRFIDNFSANVESCEIKKNSYEIKTRDATYFSPTSFTILSLDHPIIKTLTVPNHSIPALEGTNVSFDVDVSIRFNEVVENLRHIDSHYINLCSYFGLGSGGEYTESKFDKLFVKRKPQNSEVLNSKLTLPGKITYSI